MAGRGGYQPPAGPRPPGGPGKLSQRTDGNVQPIRVPDVSRAADLQYGDRQRLEQAQRIAPLPGGAPTLPGSPPPERGVTGLPTSGAQLPAWMIDMPSNRPGEPATAGLDMGPGPGSEALAYAAPPVDEREAVLEWVYTTYGNREALKELTRIRTERAAAVPAPPMSQAALGGAAPSPEPLTQPIPSPGPTSETP